LPHILTRNSDSKEETAEAKVGFQRKKIGATLCPALCGVVAMMRYLFESLTWELRGARVRVVTVSVAGEAPPHGTAGFVEYAKAPIPARSWA